MFFKIGVLKNFVIFTGKHLRWSLFCIKQQAFRPATLMKQTPSQVVSCEYYEIFKNKFFIEHLQWLLLNQIGVRFLPFQINNEAIPRIIYIVVEEKIKA